LPIMDALTQLCSQNLKWSVNGSQMTMNGFNEQNINPLVNYFLTIGF